MNLFLKVFIRMIESVLNKRVGVGFFFWILFKKGPTKNKDFFILLFYLGAPTPEKVKEKEETNGNGVKETNGVDAKKEDTEESKDDDDEEEKTEKENGKI